MAEIFRKPAHVTSSGTVNPVRTYQFGVKDTVNESEARALAANYYGPMIATPFGVLYRGDINTDQVYYNQWDVEVEYITRPKDIGTWTAEIDLTGGTEHITHSLESIANYGSGGASTAPNFKQAIGVENDDVRGVDIPASGGRLTVEFTHPSGIFNLAYAKYLGGLVNYVNSGPWLNWIRGEVRFLGPRGRISSDSQSTVIYMFELNSTRFNFTVGDITVTEKEGWDVAWTLNQRTTSTVSGVTYPVVQPQFVYIERVSPRIDFRTAFGFG